MYTFLNKKLQKGTIVYTTCTKKISENDPKKEKNKMIGHQYN